MTGNLPLLDAIEWTTHAQPDASVIWLHGLGDDGNGWAGVVHMLDLDSSARIRFIFPHAPKRPITINHGLVMRAWYDIAQGDQEERGDIESADVSAELIKMLIARELERDIVSSRIVLAGFSQGGVIALHAGLRYPKTLAGIIALSTYLIDSENFPSKASMANRDIPIFMAHGDFDDIVLPSWALASKNILDNNGYSVEWHTYPMAHAAIDEELRDIGLFLNRVLISG